MKPTGEEFISFFQQELSSLDIAEGAKVALKTLSKFVTILTSKRFGKLKKKEKSAQNSSHIVSRRNYFQPRKHFLSGQRPIGNKNIYNKKVRDRGIKIKNILAQLKNMQVKHRGRVVREMEVQCKTTHPGEKCRLQY